MVKKYMNGYIIKRSNNKTYFVFFGLSGFRYTRNKEYSKELDSRNDYEVIGNIHDNPELLEM